VEVNVELGDARCITVRRRLDQRRDDQRQTLNVAIESAGRRQPSRGAFEHLAQDVDLGVLDGVEFGDNQPATGPVDHETYGVQLLEGLADWRPAYAEPMGQILVP
jgi:hypothetical protein